MTVKPTAEDRLEEVRNTAASKQDVIECHIVWMTLDGEDPYKDDWAS